MKRELSMTQYELQNDHLSAVFSAKGAELVSVVRDGIEYIWQGDPRYWEEHSPILFPICGRLWEGKYTYKGEPYAMGLHGFARHSTFSVEEKSDAHIVFLLTPTDSIRAQYPFDFALRVEYRLEEETLTVAYRLENRGDCVMYAAMGAHPGFHVPIGGEGCFSDWYLEFDRPCSPDALLLSGAYATGKKRGMTIEDGRRIPLTRALFDDEGVFMQHTANCVSIQSDRSEHAVTMRFDAPYFGIWQPAKTEPPFLCLEPWSGFAGYEGEIAAIETKPDMHRIQPQGVACFTYSLLFR